MQGDVTRRRGDEAGTGREAQHPSCVCRSEGGCAGSIGRMAREELRSWKAIIAGRRTCSHAGTVPPCLGFVLSALPPKQPWGSQTEDSLCKVDTHGRVCVYVLFSGHWCVCVFEIFLNTSLKMKQEWHACLVRMWGPGSLSRCGIHDSQFWESNLAISNTSIFRTDSRRKRGADTRGCAHEAGWRRPGQKRALGGTDEGCVVWGSVGPQAVMPVLNRCETKHRPGSVC